MSTVINAVTDTISINHCVAITIDLGPGNVFYISDAYKPITVNGNVHTELGALLNISSSKEDLRAATSDIQISLSGIPGDQDYITPMLNRPIKGGIVTISRVFFDPETQEELVNQVYQRFSGVITNYAISEDSDYGEGKLTRQAQISCSSTLSVLENKITGQRTNSADREKFFPSDVSFDRVKELQNTEFDFGREYTGGTGYGATTTNIDFTDIDIRRFMR